MAQQSAFGDDDTMYNKAAIPLFWQKMVLIEFEQGALNTKASENISRVAVNSSGDKMQCYVAKIGVNTWVKSTIKVGTI
jgi:hypothetical protein